MTSLIKNADGAFNVVLQPSFGYVALVGVGSVFVLGYLGGQVSAARKRYGVKYPTMYAIKSENKNADQFNNYQRAHQNTLELHDMFLMLLFVSGLHDATNTAIAGAVHLVGRLVYAHAYYHGPEYRILGEFGHFGLFYMVYGAARVGGALTGLF